MLRCRFGSWRVCVDCCSRAEEFGISPYFSVLEQVVLFACVTVVICFVAVLVVGLFALIVALVLRSSAFHVTSQFWNRLCCLLVYCLLVLQ